MFAEIPNGIEGFISMTDLNDDYYEYDETRLCLSGKSTGRIYNIGDSITIKVKRADSRLREIDFELGGDGNE